VSIARRSLTLLPLAVVSRGVAFTVPVLLAQWYGVSADMDAFYYALGIPTFLLVVGATTVGSVLVPSLARLPHDRGANGAGALLGGAVVWASVGAAVFGVALTFVLPSALALTSDFSAETIEKTRQFCLGLLPFIVCVAAGSALRAGIELQARFTWSALSPVIRTSALLTAALVLRARGPSGLPLALFIGTASELLWLYSGLWTTPLRPRLVLWPATLGPALRRFAPVLVGETLVALNVVVDKVYAALLPEGSVSLLEYADRARVIPMTLFEGSLLIVAFNTWARVSAAERGFEIRRALQWVLLIAPPVLCGLWVGRVVAIQVIFERGAFGADSTVAVAAAFGLFLPGVLAAMLAGLAVKAHLLADRARLVLVLGVASFAINAGLDAVLLQFGITGLALATSLTSWMIAALSLARLWRELPTGRSWAVPIGILVASVGLAGALAAGGIEPTSLSDPRLWAAAVPFVLLLGLGLREARIK